MKPRIFNCGIARAAPAVMISTQLEMDDGDGSWIVKYPTQIKADFMVDKDQKSDSEQSHANETCGFIAVEKAGIYTE